MKQVLGISVRALLGLIPSSASAGVIFDTGNPGNTGTDNVVFTPCSGNVNGPALLVSGCLNTDNSIFVDFWGAGENLVVDGGQARIEAEDGAFTQLAFGFETATLGFTKAIFNLNTSLQDVGTITITAHLFGGGTVTSSIFSVANGENFFNVQADGTDIIDYISFVSSIGVDSVSFQDARQFRIGGNTCDPTSTACGGGGGGGGDNPEVPEPATLALTGLGLACGAAIVRKRQSATR